MQHGKQKESTGTQQDSLAGLGIFGQIQQDQMNAAILVQATTSRTSSPLQAEAIALTLAAQIANRLQLQQVTFLTDNLSLSRAAASNRASDPHIPWEIREQIASFMHASRNIDKQVYHLKRDFNKAAHRCAHQAIRHPQFRPTFRCLNSAHQNSRCPVLNSLQKISPQGIVLQIVNCV
jgi:hypothetical protein